jgi:hypothetical protein
MLVKALSIGKGLPSGERLILYAYYTISELLLISALNVGF